MPGCGSISGHGPPRVLRPARCRGREVRLRDRLPAHWCGRAGLSGVVPWGPDQAPGHSAPLGRAPRGGCAAEERISHQDMGPGAPEESADWLRAGGEGLLATLRSADPGAPMLGVGADQHVRFWSRRELHETLVHRMDAELALGRAPEASPAVAADAADEFLANLPSAARFSPKVAELRGNGTRLVFRATDTGRGWWVTLQPGGFEVSPVPTGPPGRDAGGAGSDPAPRALPAPAGHNRRDRGHRRRRGCRAVACELGSGVANRPWE